MGQFKANRFALRFVESVLVITYILFEELIWNIFAEPVLRYLKSLLLLDGLQQTFLAMNRYLLLFMFIVILGIAEGLGVLSGVSMINGYLLFGVLLYALKIPIAAFTFWLFDLTRDKLLTFNWLNTAYQAVMQLVNRIINSSIHRYIKNKVTVVKARLQKVKIKLFQGEGFLASLKRHYGYFKNRAR